MYITPIARSYWRQIKEGYRKFNDVVGEDKKEQVKYLARQEVYEGKLTPGRYEELIGEPFEV